MSYALRNTLVLLVVLLLFVVAGWGYLNYWQQPVIESLDEELTALQDELQEKEQIAARYGALAQSYEEASAYFNNYDKGLYTSSDEDKVFDFLTTVNRGRALNDFNFTFIDSATYSKYGTLSMNINGSGAYRNVVNFIRAIELSEPLNKVRNMNISPVKIDSSYNQVQYSFDLTSYYDRTEILEPRTLDISYDSYAAIHNSFYPLIRDIKPNVANEINVSQSELIALSGNKIFLIDQNGEMQQLQIGDEVYLGRLSDINLQDRIASFTLNKGGIIEKVTLGEENEE